jgi:uncharacterized protein involved in exopolysaccharide biosynthesis
MKQFSTATLNAPETTQAAPTQTARDVISILFYKKAVFAGVFAGILLITIAIAFLSPPRYQTSADLLVKPALSRPFSVTPEGTGFFTSEVTLKQLNTIIFLLQSSEHLAQVAERLGMAKRENRVDMQKAVARLKAHLHAEPLTESNVVRVSFDSENPQEAAKTLDVLVKTFADYYVEINRISGGIEFFRNQTEYLQKRLGQINREIELASAQTGVVDPAVQRQSLLQLGRDLEQERMKTLSSIEQIRAKYGSFTEALKRFETQGGSGSIGLPKTAVYDYPALVEMEKSLAQLTINLQRARNDYQMGAKPVRDAEAQYGNMRQQIRQYLRQIIDDLKGEERSASDLLASLEKRIDDLSHQTVQLSGASLTFEQLQLERDLVRKQYGLYVDKQEEARINQAKDDARFVNVLIAAHPQAPTSPVFPRPGLMIALALLIGPLIAAGLSAAVYQAEQRIYTQSDAATLVPLLGVLDEQPALSPFSASSTPSMRPRNEILRHS